nr:MAG TPA: hypothetical protein [Caudoviricetes sp.]
MSMMEVLAQMRDKEREKDGNEIQWLCLIRQDRCIKLDISCCDCPIFIEYNEGKSR